MTEWYSIEVLNGRSSARAWADSSIDALMLDALSSGGGDGFLSYLPWGCLLELAFAADTDFDRFRDLPSVRAALEGVPDPLNGLFIHRGRGGATGARRPRRPLPTSGSGGAVVLIPIDAHGAVLDAAAALTEEALEQGEPLRFSA